MKRIAIYGGAFDPPGTHHESVVRDVAPRFDETIVVPCGLRADKPTTHDVAPFHRAAMADLAFGAIPDVRVDLFDLERDVFTPLVDVEERYGRGAEAWHVIGSDLVQGGRDGASPIQRAWKRGREAWDRLRFIVHARDGYPFSDADLPPHRVVIDPARRGCSNDIRTLCFRHEPVDGLVSPKVAAYMARYGLYRGGDARRKARLSLGDIRPVVVFDEKNARAAEIARRLPEASGDANCVIAVGGDGTMMRAVREHWRLRLPFYGINAGHVGHLANALDEDRLIPEEVDVYHHPLLRVEAKGTDGLVRSSLAFNDAWVKGAESPVPGAVDAMPWIEVSVDGKVRIPKLVADGAIVATPAGSAAYAMSAGAIPLRPDSPGLNLVLAAICPYAPRYWRPALLDAASTVTFRALEPERRPMIGKVDGVSQGWVSEMEMRVSRIAAVELAFAPGHDPAAKLNALQFPS